MKNGNRPINQMIDLTGKCVGLEKIKFDDVVGLTKREYFAAMAMQGLLSNQAALENILGGAKGRTVSEVSVMFADQVLAELDKPKSE